MSNLCDVAVIGLGVMGGNLARNFASRGLKVVGYDRDPETGKKLAAAHPEAKLTIATSLADMVAALEKPRRVVLMVNAGKPVDMVLDGLDPLLEDEDIVVDAGNSHYTDTDLRLKRAESRPWRFVGMGVSGGSEGALLGPSIMPGGDVEAWERLKPVLEAIAAKSPSGVCVAYCGTGSAGHFVKMVHNGIEYGDMQLIAETAMLLGPGLGLGAAQIADTFGKWNQGDLASFLVEISADIYRAKDPEGSGLLLDAVLDAAEQKGTGKWTVIAALDLGVPIPTITAALDARGMSAQKQLRVQAQQAYKATRAPLTGVTADDLADALYTARMASYAQGMALIGAGAKELGFGTDLAEMARIWTAGCIIRAAVLAKVRAALAQKPPPALLVLAPEIQGDLARRLPALRRTVASAAAAGHAIPGLAASLTWFESLTTARGSAALIQAQRDYFGSHTYERVDKPGVHVHTDWAKLTRR